MKTSKKYLSLFLAAIMMLSTMSLPAMAAPSNTSLTPSGDVYIGYGMAAPVVNEYNFVRLFKKTPTPADWSKGSVGAFSYDISDVWGALEANDGYVVKSVKWKAYVKYSGTNAPGADFNFYMMDTRWTEDTITKNTLPANVASYPVWDNAPDVTQSSTITTSKQLQTYDLTALLRKHMKENGSEENKNFFSFAVELATTSGQAECDIDANSATTPGANAAVLEVEYFKPVPVAVDGEPVLPTNPIDDFEISFTNPINEAIVKINNKVVTEGVTINDTALVVDYPFEQCKAYIVEVYAKDDYDYSVSKTYAFATAKDTFQTSRTASAGILISKDAAPNSNISKWAGANVYYKNSSYPARADFVVYKLAMPALSDGAVIENASIDFPAWGGTQTTTIEDSFRIFKLPGESWDMAAMKSSDTTAATYLEDYDSYRADAGVTFKSASTGTWQDGRIYEANITDYVNECVERNQSNLYIAITVENATAKLAGTSYGYGSAATLRCAVNNAPAIEFINSSFEISSDVNLESLSFEALSSFDKDVIENAITLEDEHGNTISDASFEYEGAVVSLSSPVTLESNTSYNVVLASGTCDKYGNSITEDKVVFEFTTHPDDDSSFVNPEANALKVDYNSDSAAVTVLYISEYYRSHPVTVSVINTDDDSVFYTADLETDSNGILKHDDIAVTSDGNYIVYVAPLYGKKAYVDVVNEAYLDFLWELAAQSTNTSAIEERFDIICSTFNLIVGYSDKIDNIGDFYDKLTSLRSDYPIGEHNADNLTLLKAAFEEIGLFAATENISDATLASDARELYDAMLAKIADRDFANKLTELETSDADLFEAVYNRFVVTVPKSIDSVDDFENLLKEIYNEEKSAVILGKFTTMTHISQVGELLTDSDTIEVLDIQDLVDRYDALNSTSAVDKALYKKSFTSTSEFISTLSSALTSAERVDPPAEKKPSSGSGRGGSAGVGAIGAPVDTTPVVNNEKPSYTDLAGYDWAKEHINTLSAENIINGKGDGLFDPAGKVLREEAVKMIVEAFDITASGDAAFDDVSSSDWFSKYVLIAKNAGVVNGISEDLFGAGLSITRQDAVVMLYTALSKKGLISNASEASSFSDVDDIANYARDAVAYMNSVGAITGYADGTFKPTSTITRAEFAVVLGRIYNTLK